MARSASQLKRKLRDLKRLEIRTRWPDPTDPQGGRLLWESMFSTRDAVGVEYPFGVLLCMGRDVQR